MLPNPVAGVATTVLDAVEEPGEPRNAMQRLVGPSSASWFRLIPVHQS